MWEAKNGRIMVRGQPGLTVPETPISKRDWRCSSGKTSALLLRSREFKPGPTQKKKNQRKQLMILGF
jgi:hypothetical protein